MSGGLGREVGEKELTPEGFLREVDEAAGELRHGGINFVARGTVLLSFNGSVHCLLLLISEETCSVVIEKNKLQSGHLERGLELANEPHQV